MNIREFLLWLSGLRTQPVSRKMWVWSLASLSGLRIWRCHKLWCRLQMWLRSHITVALVRLAAAAPIWPLVWDLPYAMSVTLKHKIVTCLALRLCHLSFMDYIFPLSYLRYLKINNVKILECKMKSPNLTVKPLQNDSRINETCLWMSEKIKLFCFPFIIKLCVF